MSWPGQARAAERFARAVDGGRGRSVVDPGGMAGGGGSVSAEASGDTRLAGLVAVVERLREADGTTPDPVFRVRLRERLVETAAAEWAVNPPVVEPTAEPVAAPAPRPRVRPRLVLASSLAAVILAGTLVLASGPALPGDLLYPVKRGTEHVALVFAFGQEAKGRRHLALARTRVEEVRGLLDRASADRIDINAVAGALDAMDTETRTGTRLLNTVAVRQQSDGPLVLLASWTTDQRALVGALVDRLPADVRTRAVASLDLLRQVADRAAVLRSQLACDCLGTAAVDDLGPLPCTQCATPSTAPTSPSTSVELPGTHGRSSQGAGSGSPSTPGSPGAGGGAPGAGSGGRPSAGGGGLPAPTGSNGLPLPVPSLPGPSAPVPSLPGPSVPVPSVPAPSLPGPSLPSLPLPTLPGPTLPSLPVPSLSPPGLPLPT